MKTLTPAANSANFFELNPLLVGLGQDQAAIVTEPTAACKPAESSSTALWKSGSQAKHGLETIAWVLLGMSGVVVLLLSFWGL